MVGFTSKYSSSDDCFRSDSLGGDGGHILRRGYVSGWGIGSS